MESWLKQKCPYIHRLWQHQLEWRGPRAQSLLPWLRDNYPALLAECQRQTSAPAGSVSPPVKGAGFTPLPAPERGNRFSDQAIKLAAR
jgi:hypothetical protein